MSKGPSDGGAAKQGFGWALRCLVLVVVLIVALGVIGSMASPSASATPVPSSTHGAVQATPEAPTDTPVPTGTPAPAPKVLLSLKANGIKNSKPFTASGDSLDLAYTFDCKAFGHAGNFAVTLYDQSGLAALAVNELAKSGKDTPTVYLGNTTAPFHLEINSECAWTVTVTGQP